MNFLPLFLKQLRNSRASTLLNLLGLTIALSSFIILIAQVRYELTYDTHFRDADRIFRIEIAMTPPASMSGDEASIRSPSGRHNSGE